MVSALTDTAGAIEQDFENITPGEKVTFRWACYDADDAAITSFSGWTVKMYICASRGIANGITALATAALKVIDADLSSVPNISAVLSAAGWSDLNTDMKARRYYYELWRTDSDDEQRLAFGKISTRD